MGLLELFLVAVGLSMDAFAVAICKGLGMKRLNMGQALVIALFFGGFQALMPVFGWLLGSQFAHIVEPVDHWIAFALLAFIGGKMLVDALREGDEDETAEANAPNNGNGSKTLPAAAPGATDVADASSRTTEASAQGGANGTALANAATTATAEDAVEADAPLDLGELVMLAVATSIDALAVGVTFAFLHMDIVFPALFIGVTTFALSLAGVAIGHQFGRRWEKPSTIAGGVVLILIGCKILLEHLGILIF